MSASDERTPLLSSAVENSLPRERAPTGVTSPDSRPRLISDALSRIISATSLDCLVPSDLLNLNSAHLALSEPDASAEDYAYTLTALLAYRRQQVAQLKAKAHGSAAAGLDLYGQWTQEKSAEGDVALLERHVDVVWGQFLGQYRTDGEIDSVLWTPFRKEEESGVWLKVADFLEEPDAYLGLLKHPLVEAAVPRRWKHGRHYAANQSSATLLQRLDTLAGTPRSTHLLALTSHFIYLYLLAHFLIYPPDRVSTDLWAVHRDIHWNEIFLVTFTLGNLLFVRYPFNFLYCVVLVALLLPFPGSPQAGDGFFDILLLAFAVHIWSFHRPSAISPLFVSDLSRTVPLAAFVHRSITDGVAPSFFYFGPALIVSIVLLSVSLDGSYLQAVHALLTSKMFLAIPAPMETRNAFLTIALVVFLCLFFCIFATTAAGPVVRSARAPKNAWDRFGMDIGHRARSVAVAVCSAYDGAYVYPPPFNLLHLVLVAPFELVGQWLGWSVSWVKELDLWLWRVTVLPFLLAAFLLSKVL